MAIKTFALIGAAGYVAPRHVRAVKETGNVLLAAIDPHDNIGFLDNYYPKTRFFTKFERFNQYINKLKNENNGVDFISICSPNHLHDTHIKSALNCSADAICEKPLVLNPRNLNELKKIEDKSGQRVWNILQLRYHPSIVSLKKKIEAAAPDKSFEIDLTYVTSRGLWYYTSWKGQEEKSGGIATNIGVHFFDMLSWIFGDVKENLVHLHAHDRATGYLEFEKAKVRWFLSINSELLPNEVKAEGKTTFRSMVIDGKECDFSDGFIDLHTTVYEDIIAGSGFGIEDIRGAIEIAHSVRTQTPLGLKGEYHPLAKSELRMHPFDNKQ